MRMRLKKEKVNDAAITEMQGGRGDVRGWVRTSAEKVTQGGNLPVDHYLLWSSCYAGGRLDICMRNWRWHKSMNLLTHGRTHERDASEKWSLPYAIVRWTVVRDRPSLRVGTLTRTIYTSSCPRKIGPRASERAVCGKKGGARLSFPPRAIRPFCTSLAARNAANWRCQLGWNIDREPASRAKFHIGQSLRESYVYDGKSVQAVRLNSTMIFICPTVNSSWVRANLKDYFTHILIMQNYLIAKSLNNDFSWGSKYLYRKLYCYNNEIEWD